MVLVGLAPQPLLLSLLLAVLTQRLDGPRIQRHRTARALIFVGPALTVPSPFACCCTTAIRPRSNSMSVQRTMDAFDSP